MRNATSTPQFRRVVRYGVVGIACLAIGCQADLPTAVVEVSSLDGGALNAKVMKSLRGADQGCVFSIPDPTGGRRVLDLRGKRLPFALDPIKKDLATGRGDGRVVEIRVTPASLPEAITVSCWVPSTLSLSELLGKTSGVSWKSMYARLRHAKLISATDIARPISREVQQYKYENIKTPPAPISFSPMSNQRALRNVFDSCTWIVVAGVTPNPIAAGARKPSFDTVGSCTCTIFEYQDEETGEWYWEHGECSLAGGGEDPTPLEDVYIEWIPDPDWSEVVTQLESEFCGYLGCYDDGGGSGTGLSLDVELTGTFSSSDHTPGQTVTFHAQANQLTLNNPHYYWSWTSRYPDDGTTTSGYCGDDATCQMPVNGDGRMDVDIQTDDGNGFGFDHVTTTRLGSEDGDSPEELTPPTCNPMPNSTTYPNPKELAKALAWCDPRTRTPTSADRQVFEVAISRMQNRGPVCAELANKMQSLLDTPGMVKIFPDGVYAFGGYANSEYANFQNVWTVLGGNKAQDGRNMDQAIAHEMDHALGHKNPPTVTDEEGHLYVNGALDRKKTINSEACAG